MRRRLTKSENVPDATKDRVIDDARAVLDELRIRTRLFVQGAPTPIGRAADLHKALGVDAPLGWQVFRIAIARDPLSTLPYVPRAGSMQKILRQAGARGWDEPVVRRLEEAYDRFTDFVKQTAGSRGNFDAMIAGFENEASEQIGMGYRAAACRAAGRVWGIRARTDYRALIFQAGAVPESEHLALVQGRVDLRSSRPNAVLALRRGSLYDTGGAPVGSMGQTSVLEDFCTKPCPKVETLVGTDGATEVLRLDLVKPGTPVTFFGLQVHPNFGIHALETCWGAKALSTVPSDLMIIDVLVPRGWIDPATARVSVHGNLADMLSAYVDTEAFSLPAKEQFEDLGSDLQALHTPEIPRCPEMIASVLKALNWTDEGLTILRCRVRYPILHSLIWFRVSAPY